MDINPLALSLDEVIKLNKLRNQEAQQQASSSHVAVKTERNGLVNGHDAGEDITDITSSIQNELSENSERQYRTVHDRLGWIKKPNQQRYSGRTTSQNQALRAIRNAQNFKNRTAVRVVRNNSRGMFPPLTTSVLRRHNQNTGNFTVQRRVGGAASVASMSTLNMKPKFYRHSMKKCLDPEIQQLIRNMLNDGEPATVQGSQGKIIIDKSFLLNYKPQSDCTALPTHVRFAMNDAAINE